MRKLNLLRRRKKKGRAVSTINDVFLQGAEIVLKDTSVYLPIPKSSVSLQLFHDIEDSSFFSQYFKVTAIDLGLYCRHRKGRTGGAKLTKHIIQH